MSEPHRHGAGASDAPHAHHRDDEHPHEHPHDHPHDHPHPTGLAGVLQGLFSPHSHDAADSIDDALEGSARGIRAVKVSLVGMGATAVLQLGIVAISGSVALLADTIHNFGDALTAIPLWIAFALRSRTPRRGYTYGYGRAEDVAGLFIIAMITLSAVIAGVESVRGLIHPVVIENLWWVAGAGLIGFIGNELVAIYRTRVGHQIGSAALVADGLHARTDGLTSLAVLAGALGVAAGVPLADPIVGLMITATILLVLRTALRDVFRRLLDGVEPDLVDRARDALGRSPGVTAVHQVRLRWIGHEIHADAVLGVDAATTVAAAATITHEAEQALTRAVPKLSHMTIQTTPTEALREPPGR